MQYMLTDVDDSKPDSSSVSSASDIDEDKILKPNNVLYFWYLMYIPTVSKKELLVYWFVTLRLINNQPQATMKT